MSRNARIISKIATKCNVCCIIGLSIAVLAVTWMFFEVFINEPISDLAVILACVGCASSACGMYIGKTIEDVK